MSNTEKKRQLSLTEDQLRQIIEEIVDAKLADLRDDMEIYTDDQITNLRDSIVNAFDDAKRGLWP